MDKIAQEIEEMAEKMEKSNQDPNERLFAVIKALGKDRLKAKMATLSDDEKTVLKSALEHMNLQKAVSFDKEAQSVHHVRGNIMDTQIQEDKADDDVDETLVKLAAAHQDHQGTPTDGWEGQVIKAAEELTDEEVDKLFNPFAHLVTEMPEEFTKAYEGFKKLEGKLKNEKGVENPAAVAASIGRKKYGKQAFQNAASEGKKMKKSDIIAELKKSDELLTRFIYKSLDQSGDPEAVLAKCLELGLSKAKVMGAMNEYAKDKKVMAKIKKGKMKEEMMKEEEKKNKEKDPSMKKGGTPSTVQKEEENPEANKQDGDAPDLQVGGQNKSGVKKEAAPNISDVGQASKDAQKDVNNLSVGEVKKAIDSDKSKEEAKIRDEGQPQDFKKDEKKDDKKKMKKSVSWEGEDRLLKANTNGRNFNFNLEGFVSETLKKSEEKPTEEIKKSEKVDLNDLIEKSMDRNWNQLSEEKGLQENTKKINGKLVKSFEDNEIAQALGLSEEEAKKILG